MVYFLAIRILFMCLYAMGISVRFIPETGTPPSYRELSATGLDAEKAKLYIYGGRSKVLYGDMREFNFTSKKWNEIYPASVFNPGPRSNAYMIKLQNQRKFVLFGGDNSSGLISDVWVYEIDNERVLLI